MRDDSDGELGVTERARLRTAEREKRGRADRDGGLAAFLDLYAVVDTPRRAGPSVARAGDHHVAGFAQFGNDLGGRGGRGGSLTPLLDACNAVLAHEELRE